MISRKNEMINYLSIIQIWLNHWKNLIPFFEYPEDIRKAIYTTHVVGSYKKQREFFPTDNPVFKILYLAINNLSKNGICLSKTRKWLWIDFPLNLRKLGPYNAIG